MASRTSRNSVETLEPADDHAAASFESFQGGASEIQMSAVAAMPAAGRFLGRIVYNTSYVISFGVTLPVMMIVRIVPKENAMVHGLVDGAMAARDQALGWHHEMLEDHHDAEEDDLHSLNGTGDHDDDESADHAAHPRRTRAKRTTGGTTRKAARTSSRKKG